MQALAGVRFLELTHMLSGPHKERPAYDMVAQAMGGAMSITGPAEGLPTRAGMPITDLGGGMFGAIGILAALAARERTGRGQHIDISMLDAQISMLNFLATIHLLSGDIPQRHGSAHPHHVPYDIYLCQDDYIILAVVTDKFWQSLMEIVALPELADEENRTRQRRIKNRAWIDQRLSEVLRAQTRDFWLEKLRATRIPCAPVNDFAQAFAESQVLARNMIVEVEYPQGGCVRMPGNPIKLSETQVETFLPAPLVGDNNEEVFEGMLRKTEDEIVALKAAGAI